MDGELSSNATAMGRFSRLLLLRLLAAFVCLASSHLAKSQSLRPSLSSPEERARTQYAATGYDYNLKLGPAFVSLGSSLGLEYNDNINLADSRTTGPNGAKSDFIYRPAINVHATWPVTKLNVLSFDLGLGVQRYLNHPDYNQTNVTVSPNSQLNFDLYVGNVRFNFHDQLSVSQNAATRADASNTGPYTEVNNAAGVTALWDLNKTILQASYDYGINRFITSRDSLSGNSSQTSATPDQTITTTREVSPAQPAQPPRILPGGIVIPGKPGVPAKTVTKKQTIPGTRNQFQAQARFSNSTSNIFNTSMTFPLSASLATGLQANYILTNYEAADRPDITTVGVGPFLRVSPTRYTTLQASGGYQKSSYQYSGSENAFAISSSATQQGNFYYSFSLSNQLNRFYQQSITLSRQNDLGLTANTVETDSFNYNLQWRLNSRLSLGANAFYEIGQQQQLGGEEKFHYFGWGMSFGYQLTRHLSTNFHYTHTQRNSDRSFNDYSQNTVGLDFGYAF